ncbi:MAG: DUF429 domain-containing protein [Chloroflexota bacterium]|nr:MAG: DUF429 domain-containing protein [Chloroflexota bacterium]
MSLIEPVGTELVFAGQPYRDLQPRPRRIHGVDFSGAVDAGWKIWIASGSVDEDCLRIEDCRRAEDLPGSGKPLDRCLPALRELIAGETHGVFGLDFPFGLPDDLVRNYGDWDQFVLDFSKRYPGPKDFRQDCFEQADHHERKRATDRENAAPFAAYNLKLYRQTYYGIRDVLAPLVRERRAYVLPMQSAHSGRPWLVEICPACTLKKEHLYLSYKGTSMDRREARAYILAAIERIAPLVIPDKDLRARIIADAGGDALDSVIAAVATFRSIPRMIDGYTGKQMPYPLEGFIFV